MTATTKPPVGYVTIRTIDGKYAKAMLMGSGKKWLVNEFDTMWTIDAWQVAEWLPLDVEPD